MNDQELRTQLWDYCYGLLEPAEAAALEVRIKSDPRIARLYAETRLESDLLAGAARLEQPPIPLTTRVSPTPASLPRTRGPRPARRAAWANWVAGLAAVLLVGLFAYGWRPATSVAVVSPDVDGVAPQREQGVIAELRGPAQAREGQSVQFDIQTFDAQNAPKPAELNLQIVDAAGNAEFEAAVTTDEKGRGEVSVPGDAVRRGRTLQLKDRAADATPLVAAPLDVTADAYQAHLEVDREIMRPGETVFFRALVLGANSHVETTPTDAEFFLVDPAGEPVPGSSAKDVTAHGVAAGEAVIPSNAAEGEYGIVVRSPHDRFAATRIPVQVRREETPQFALGTNAARSVEMKSMAGRTLAKQQDAIQAATAGSPASRPSPADAPAAPGKPLATAPTGDSPASPAAAAPATPGPPSPPALARKAEGRAPGEPVVNFLAESAKKEAKRSDKADAFGGGVGRGGIAGGGAEGGSSSTPAAGAAGVPAGGFGQDDARRGKEREASPKLAALTADETFKRLKIELTRDVEDLTKRDASTQNGVAEQSAVEKSFERGAGNKVASSGLADAKGDGGEAKAARQQVQSSEDRPLEFAPGQEVSLKLATLTEGGEHIPAVLGVRVVQEELAAAGDWNRIDEFLVLSAGGEADKRFTVTEEVLRRRSESATNAPASGERAEREELTERDARPAPVVTLGSNRTDVEVPLSKFKEDASHPALGSPSAAPAIDARPLGKRLLVGGLLGLVAIGSLLVWRVPVRGWAWGPALVAAAACVTLGIVRLAPPRAGTMVAETPPPKAEKWAARQTEELQKTLKSIDGAAPATEVVPESAPQDLRTLERLPLNRADERETRDDVDAQEAYAKQAKGTPEAKPVDATEGEVRVERKRNKDRQVARDKSPAVPPATLLWNPRLITDETGAARIQFRLPEQPGRYRVQIQGHSNGRLGAAELVIQSQSPSEVGATPAKPAATSAPAEAKSAEPQPAKPTPAEPAPEESAPAEPQP